MFKCYHCFLSNQTQNKHIVTAAPSHTAVIPSSLIRPGVKHAIKSSSSEDEGSFFFEEQERCLNLLPFFRVPVGSVCEKASHVSFRSKSDFVLDQCLIEKSWIFPLCKNMNVCKHMKVNLRPTHRTRPVSEHFECKV